VSSDLDSLKSQIIERLTLASVVETTVKLTRRSGRLVGLCPFHNESGPSFYVFDDGHYYCFGCKAHGDIIDFVRKSQGLGFMDALRFLAERAGIPFVSPSSFGNKEAFQEKQKLYQIMQEAQSFFVAKLHSPAGAGAFEYLRARGFSDANIQAFGFGFAPDDFEAQVTTYRSKGFTDQQMFDTSLASRSEKSGRVFDFFRNRLMIPIKDSMGRVIAFGGRTMSNDPAKYVNSRESKLYDKSTVLFGLEKAKEAARKVGRIIITEGYMDTLQLWQQGVTEAVACLGTALTVQQLRLIAPSAKLCVLVFDGDFAGQNATLRTVTTALQVPDVEVRAASLPEGDDPDSFIRKRGAEAFKLVVQGSQPLLDFAIRQKVRSTHSLAIPELVSQEFVPWLAKVPDAIQRSFLIQRVADLTGIPSSQLQAEMRRVGSAAVAGAVKAGDVTMQSPTPKAEKYLLQAFEIDLLGHIFFSIPEPEVIAKIQAILHMMKWPPTLQLLTADILTQLASGHCPADTEFSNWESCQSPSVIRLLEGLNKRRAAFDTHERLDRLKKIERICEVQTKQSARTLLKRELQRAAPDEQMQILTAISDINKDLQSLEKH
jgi:DNA primase